MGRPPCCEEISGVKKGPWTPEEDDKLISYISKHGSGSWRTLPKHAGLNRCGKSCRLRWTNYLKPDIKRGKFTEEEEKLIINLHSVLGNKWSKIATHLPGRTDNEIKNFWNTSLRKKLLQMGIDPETHKPRTDLKHLLILSQLLDLANNNNNNLMISPWSHAGLSLLQQQPDLTHQLVQIQLLQNLLQLMNNGNSSSFVNYMNHSLINNPIEADLNGINSALPNNKESFLRENQEIYASPALFPSSSAQSESHQDISESSDHQQVLGINNNNSISRTSSHEINQAENNPFAAANSSAGNFFNQMESSNADGASSTVFDAWEKLLEDDASDSYWKELLDLTSTSTTPISR